ncbi:transposase [Paenibacillus turicensis]|uniref:Transposase n=1 Tax=Paenibacillus turicensis TaxID=160487 RepID=A0ABS4FZ22_9BACL|nr:IS110 family transposase [Paenibacillus turicensis]MBP1907807.1 transposase [Paenibacillus turicensis]
MKFKQSAKQNQRIERISSKHLIIGIDIAKFTHVARATNYRGIEQGRYLAFSNNVAGFKQLQHWVQSLMHQGQLSTVIFGVEPTGHYWLNLAYWLQDQKLELVLVNPFQVKRNKENRDNSPTKNDIKDALVIADMVKNGYYSELFLHAEPYRALRQLVNTREFISKQMSTVVNQLHRWTDLYFPEFRSVFKDITSKTAISTLTQFPHPSQLRLLNEDEIITGWKKDMKRAGSRQVARELIQVAQQSATLPGTVEEALFSLSLLLQQYHLLRTQLDQLEQEVLTRIADIPTTKVLSTIKGISAITLATLYSEAGDLASFAHGNQLLRLAGLHLQESSSGTHRGISKITKRGRPRLRKILFLTVLHMVAVHPEFKALHQHNIRVKRMIGMKSIMKLCGKLARMLVAMAKNHCEYLSNKLRMIA